ncbi:hypothetical protein T552_02124 [Pneumocystis carinii B80]|uniref:Thioredoxin domain-containing protein n=1 Tax=Pneumocystis carinii (strain B80) TaxID=1408658 RepID=A0A0W4ZH31_PNEC8|nr:hypothetical protein T552_02124 [Pneumocystis carinii B80]KTW27684.1 hypothetical protein T552_02124 [Pneumocystis carinii B80]
MNSWIKGGLKMRNMFVFIRKKDLSGIRCFLGENSVEIGPGDRIPNEKLMEKNLTDLIDLGEILPKKAIIIGVPGAFSPTCSIKHLPGFLSRLNEFEEKGVGLMACISVNDVFVMNAWKSSFCIKSPMVRFFADPTAQWTKAANLSFDATKVFGNHRSKRYVLFIEDGLVKKAFIEPNSVGLVECSAERILGAI